MKKNLFAILFIVGMCYFFLPKARGEEVAEIDRVMEKLEQRWDSLTSFSADVYSIIQSGDIKILEAHGQFYFQKPLQLKLDMHSVGMEGALNVNTLIVDDGSICWQIVSSPKGKILGIEKNEREFAKQMRDVLQEKLGTSYNVGLIDLREMFKMMHSMKYRPESLEEKVVDGKQCCVLRMSLNAIIQKDILRAARSDKFTGDYSLVAKDILIYFQPEDYIIFRMDNINLLDESICQRFEYSNIKLDTPIEKTVFSYVLPPGVKVQEGNLFRRKSTSVKSIVVEKSVALINQPCPEFSLTNLDHKLYRFKKLKGRILLITFWAEFKENSLRTLPIINRLYEKYKSNKNVRILTIARGSKERIEKLLKDNYYNFPVLIDKHLEASRNQFFVRFVPMTFFVDKQGIIRDVYYGDGDEAEGELVKKLILLEWEYVKKDYREYCDKGVKFLDNKNSEEAINCFTQAIDMFDDQFEAYHMRATVYSRNGDYEKAIADFDKALDRSFGNSRSLYGKGLVYMKLKQYEKAIESFNDTLKIDPKEVWAQYNRGVAFYELGEYDKAIADYNIVLQKEKNDADTYYKRGLSFEKIGDYKRAIADYNMALKKDKNLTAARLDKARVLELLNK
ncbi:MAG: tetratricopeptide repeat protein [Candidatus Omnitrophica bacterium]|nr:tetratricopeptide repeat protein [Candidatus Omnitrophota bacterium]